MKMLLPIISFVLVIIVSINTLNAQHKIGSIDTDKIQQELMVFHKIEQHKTQTNDSLILWRNNWTKDLHRKFERALNRCYGSRMAMKKVEEEIKKEEMALQHFYHFIEDTLSNIEIKIAKTLKKSLTDYIKEYGKEHYYFLILGHSSALYFENRNDITHEILNNLFTNNTPPFSAEKYFTKILDRWKKEAKKWESIQ